MAAAAVVAGTLALWLSPMVFETNADDQVVTCAAFTGENYGGLWPYSSDINEWIADGNGGTPELELAATLGMYERCGVVRENRQTALFLTAIGGATLLILTKPSASRRQAA